MSAAWPFTAKVLGFEIREPGKDYGAHAAAELVAGPARIQLSTDSGRGAAVLFFETDDVDATHAYIAARGGEPSNIERVNWIKMAMFEVRDPDGHSLWFGKSFNKPHTEEQPAPGMPFLWQILPELPLDDVPAGVAYYCDVLGFKINYSQNDLGVMFRDKITLLLIARTERHQGIGSAYVYVDNVDALCGELKAKGAKVQGEPVSRPWGLRDFAVLDLEGNRITFAQTFE